MRYPKMHKEHSRRRIVKAAARAFNRHGLDGIGVADIMKKAGLTPGTFTTHFTSKEELIREAMDDAFKLSTFELPEWQNRSLEDLLRNYVNAFHRDDVEGACPATSLVSDVARRSPKTREKFSAFVERTTAAIESRLPSKIRGADRWSTAVSIFSLVAGAVQLARVTRGTKFSDQILEGSIKGALALAGE